MFFSLKELAGGGKIKTKPVGLVTFWGRSLSSPFDAIATMSFIMSKRKFV